MILITSGAYLGPEFTSELGLLPPSFLPVGNTRLFTLQARELSNFGDPIVLSLPESFRIAQEDSTNLEAAGITVMRVPDGLSLAASILHVLCAFPAATPHLRILHGDTLILSPPEGLDLFSVGHTAAYTNWAVYDSTPGQSVTIHEGLSGQGTSREVLSGFFSFSDRAELMKALALSRDSFIGALNSYAASAMLSPCAQGEWLDFGHLHTYHQSKAHVTTQRRFNSLSIGPASVVKTSSDSTKMLAEALWFENLPPRLRLNTPRYIGRVPSGYQLEYLYLSTLSELLVFGELPEGVWMRAMQACARFLASCRQEAPPAGTLPPGGDLFLPKTMSRLKDFAETTGLSLEHPWNVNGQELPGLARVAREAAEVIPKPHPQDLCLIHGDFCFSNIFYDFRRQDVLAIDPRGLDAAGRPTSYGDIRYDIAKLYHSAVAGYDFIKAGACRFTQEGDYHLSLALPDSAKIRGAQYAFLSTVLPEAGLGLREIKAMNVHLFPSMLPLHADKPGHQMALLANGLRIFASLSREDATLDGMGSDRNGRMAA
jgi:hypothetical protein